MITSSKTAQTISKTQLGPQMPPHKMEPTLLETSTTSIWIKISTATTMLPAMSSRKERNRRRTRNRKSQSLETKRTMLRGRRERGWGSFKESKRLKTNPSLQSIPISPSTFKMGAWCRSETQKSPKREEELSRRTLRESKIWNARRPTKITNDFFSLTSSLKDYFKILNYYFCLQFV